MPRPGSLSGSIGLVQPTEIYNLAGQRVDEHYKGIVIKNGKKIIYN